MHCKVPPYRFAKRVMRLHFPMGICALFKRFWDLQVLLFQGEIGTQRPLFQGEIAPMLGSFAVQGDPLSIGENSHIFAFSYGDLRSIQGSEA